MEDTSLVIGGLSEFKEDKKSVNNKSLLNRIKEAKNSTEITYLLSVGGTYKNVSLKTMRMWSEEAARKTNSFRA